MQYIFPFHNRQFPLLVILQIQKCKSSKNALIICIFLINHHINNKETYEHSAIPKEHTATLIVIPFRYEYCSTKNAECHKSFMTFRTIILLYSLMQIYLLLCFSFHYRFGIPVCCYSFIDLEYFCVFRSITALKCSHAVILLLLQERLRAFGFICILDSYVLLDSFVNASSLIILQSCQGLPVLPAENRENGRKSMMHMQRLPSMSTEVYCALQ